MERTGKTTLQKHKKTMILSFYGSRRLIIYLNANNDTQGQALKNKIPKFCSLY